MNAVRRRLNPLTWLALVMMLALVLLPTLSHALAFAQGQTSWAEVCTPQGMRVVAVGATDSNSGGPTQAVGHLEHCPYCSLGALALGFPPASASLAVLVMLQNKPPALFLQGPRTLFAWHSAQPRGPPVFS